MACKGRQLPLAMFRNECLLVHVTHSTADFPVSARSGHEPMVRSQRIPRSGPAENHPEAMGRRRNLAPLPLHAFPASHRPCNRRCMRPTNPHLSPDKEAKARYVTRLPAERVQQQPMAYDPASGQIVAPWPRGTITEEDGQALIAVLDQIATFNLRVPVWLWPTGDRAPVPIDADNPRTWFARWGENRAVYRDRRYLGPR
jgi:hypothetical protein